MKSTVKGTIIGAVLGPALLAINVFSSQRIAWLETLSPVTILTMGVTTPTRGEEFELIAILILLQAVLYAAAGFVIGLFVQISRGEG